MCLDARLALSCDAAVESSSTNPLSYEGEVVELVPLNDVLAGGGGDYLDAEDRERLHASIDRGVEDIEGRTVDADEVIAELRARSQ